MDPFGGRPGHDPFVIWRHRAYRCFLAASGAVLLLVMANIVYGLGWLPEAWGTTLSVLVLFPVAALGFLAMLAGIVMGVKARYDLRLHAISLISIGLVVLWARYPALGVSPRLGILYPVGVLLFSLRYLLERRQELRRAK